MCHCLLLQPWWSFGLDDLHPFFMYPFHVRLNKNDAKFGKFSLCKKNHDPKSSLEKIRLMKIQKNHDSYFFVIPVFLFKKQKGIILFVPIVPSSGNRNFLVTSAGCSGRKSLPNVSIQVGIKYWRFLRVKVGGKTRWWLAWYLGNILETNFIGYAYKKFFTCTALYRYYLLST